jgi:hypothetical protein
MDFGSFTVRISESEMNEDARSGNNENSANTGRDFFPAAQSRHN